MSVVAAAVVGSAVVGAYSSSKASKAQAKSAQKGMEAEERIAYENRELQRELAEQQREDFAPWRDVGEQALNQMWAGVQSGEFLPEKFDPSQIDLEQDPGYKFRMDQGVEALDKSAAARGHLLSGAQQKALTEYGQDMGSQEYANAYARYADQYAKEADRRARKYNILSSISGQGQASAAQQAGATSQLAQSEGNILSNLGRAQNISQQNIGAARASGYQGMAQSANQAAQNWLLYKNLGAGAA
jgi:hypothetical protein